MLMKSCLCFARTVPQLSVVSTVYYRMPEVFRFTPVCSYLDEVLIEMKLTPYDVEIQVPPYYRRDREEKLHQIRNDIDRILNELGKPIHFRI